MDGKVSLKIGEAVGHRARKPPVFRTPRRPKKPPVEAWGIYFPCSSGLRRFWVCFLVLLKHCRTPDLTFFG